MVLAGPAAPLPIQASIHTRARERRLVPKLNLSCSRHPTVTVPVDSPFPDAPPPPKRTPCPCILVCLVLTGDGGNFSAPFLDNWDLIRWLGHITPPITTNNTHSLTHAPPAYLRQARLQAVDLLLERGRRRVLQDVAAKGALHDAQDLGGGERECVCWGIHSCLLI